MVDVNPVRRAKELQNDEAGKMKLLLRRQGKANRPTQIVLGNSFKAINRAEKALLREIEDIDAVLKHKNTVMQYHGGFLFSQGVTPQLISHFRTRIVNHIDAVEQGFCLWKVAEDEEGINLISSRMAKPHAGFAQKLIEKSVENLQNYDDQKYEQSLKQAPKRWKHFSKADRAARIKTEATPDKDTEDIALAQELKKYSHLKHSKMDSSVSRKLTSRNPTGVDPINLSKLTDSKLVDRSQSTVIYPYLSQPSAKSTSKRIVLTEHKDPPVIGDATKEELMRMLAKEDEVISVWVGPASYPQLIGVMSLHQREPNYLTRVCQVRKYYWLRQSVSRRLFESILEWASSSWGYVHELQLVTSRQVYGSLFSVHGWRISGWASEDKLRICFGRPQ